MDYDYWAHTVADFIRYNFFRSGAILSSGIVATSLLAYATARRNVRKSFGAVAKYRSDMASPIPQETLYLPSGEINEESENKNEFWDQQLLGGQRIRLIDVFDPKQAPKMVDYVLKAMKRCTPDNPIVRDHLHEVIPQKHYDAVMDAYDTGWINYFAGRSELTHLRLIDFQRCTRQRPEMEIVYPVLTVQEGAYKRHSRVIMMHESFLRASMPAFEDTRFNTEHGFVHDPRHPQAPRYNYVRIVRDRLNEDSALRRACGFMKPTGVVVTIEDPLFSDAEIAENHI